MEIGEHLVNDFELVAGVHEDARAPRSRTNEAVRLDRAGAARRFSGARSRRFLGVRLPLSSKTVQDWTEAAALSFDKAAEKYECSNSALREQLISLARYSLNQLT